MKRAAIIGGLIVLAVILLPAGYLLWKVNTAPQYDPATLEGIAQERVRDCGTAQPVLNFEIIERRDTADGTLLLFRAECFSLYRFVPIYGYLYGTQIGPGQIQGNMGYGLGYGDTISGLAEYSLGGQLNDATRPTVLYGRTLTAEVATVAAEFSSGTVLQDETSEGYFAVIDPAGGVLKALTLFDAAGNELPQ
ncbi:MAG: hypothetical protein KDD73_10075 [Anaerolineales bacterium]|nr:hypothetical protein [Anaerolineales bacterium]MCB9128903.1 hypothetical protein [Ardenticatenales bacterium]